MRLQTNILENSKIKFSFTHAAETEAEAKVLADAYLLKFKQDSQYNAQTMTVEFLVSETSAQETMRLLFMSQQKDVEFGKAIAAKIIAIAGSKAMSEAAIDELFDNTLLMKLERMLKAGAISTAKRNMATADISSLLEDQEKDSLLTEMQTYLDS